MRFAVSSIIYFGFVPLDTQERVVCAGAGAGVEEHWDPGKTKDKAQYGARVATPGKFAGYIQTTFTILFTRLLPSNIQRSIEAEYARVSYIIYQVTKGP